jgi:hypothetical protein
MSSSSEAQSIRQLLFLRTIVAALGERTTPPRWRTQFLTDFGLRALVRVFPRTPVHAALDSVFVAARLEHDQRIGLGKRYHLFRLPESLERTVSDVISEPAFSAQAAAMVADTQNTLMDKLASIASKHTLPAVDGPISLGSIAKLTEPTVLASLAAHYWNSFESARRVFPYFAESEERR